MFKKIISLVLSVIFSAQTCGFAQVAQLNLAGYLGQGKSIPALDRFRPASLRYFSYQPKSDNFRILLDKADEKGLSDIQVKEKADELMKYFRIGLSLPNDKFWVNLRPDAPEQIIDDELAMTDIGRIMLEADLQLKKDTASFTSPQTKEGKEYWNKLYQKAGELFGTENITIPTITRPWIVPGEIIVRESGNSGLTPLTTGAYIYKAALKVMLEEDYLTSRGGSRTAPTYQQYAFSDPRLKELNQYSTQLIRELIIPKLTKEINRAKRYAGLRQVFYSLVLSRWFKDKFKGLPPEGTVPDLIDSSNLTNLTSKQAWDKTTYFKAYQKSFKEGEYNLSEPVYTPTGQVIRRYMSGGIRNLQPAKLNNVFIADSLIVKPGNGEFFEIAGNSITTKVDDGTMDASEDYYRALFVEGIELSNKLTNIRAIINDLLSPIQSERDRANPGKDLKLLISVSGKISALYTKIENKEEKYYTPDEKAKIVMEIMDVLLILVPDIAAYPSIKETFDQKLKELGEILESAQTRAGKPKEHIKDGQTTASPLDLRLSLISGANALLESLGIKNVLPIKEVIDLLTLKKVFDKVIDEETKKFDEKYSLSDKKNSSRRRTEWMQGMAYLEGFSKTVSIAIIAEEMDKISRKLKGETSFDIIGTDKKELQRLSKELAEKIEELKQHIAAGSPISEEMEKIMQYIRLNNTDMLKVIHSGLLNKKPEEIYEEIEKWRNSIKDLTSYCKKLGIKFQDYFDPGIALARKATEIGIDENLALAASKQGYKIEMVKYGNPVLAYQFSLSKKISIAGITYDKFNFETGYGFNKMVMSYNTCKSNLEKVMPA